MFDYLAPPSSFIFPSDVHRVCVLIVILNDHIIERTEMFDGHLLGFVRDGMSSVKLERVNLDPNTTRVLIFGMLLLCTFSVLLVVVMQSDLSVRRHYGPIIPSN